MYVFVLVQKIFQKQRKNTNSQNLQQTHQFKFEIERLSFYTKISYMYIHVCFRFNTQICSKIDVKKFIEEFKTKTSF